MTLIELLVSMTIASVVFAVAGSLVTMLLHASGRIESTSSTSAAGRLAMEQIAQRLRSQVCLNGGEYQINGAAAPVAALHSVRYASRTKLIFLADIGRTGSGATGAAASKFTPELRWIYVDATSATNVKLVEGSTRARNTDNTEDTAYPYNFKVKINGTEAEVLAIVPEVKRALIDRVAPATEYADVSGVMTKVDFSGDPVYPYFSYFNSAGAEITPAGAAAMPAPVIGVFSNNTLDKIARVKVRFRSLPTSSATENTKRGTDFINDFYLSLDNVSCQ